MQQASKLAKAEDSIGCKSVYTRERWFPLDQRIIMRLPSCQAASLGPIPSKHAASSCSHEAPIDSIKPRNPGSGAAAAIGASALRAIITHRISRSNKTNVSRGRTNGARARRWSDQYLEKRKVEHKAPDEEERLKALCMYTLGIKRLHQGVHRSN
jgi:hypothetical protein